MLVIDGSQGEGGGQILRTSLALSIVTGKPVRIAGIRAGRRKPGLMRQHLTGVLAAAEVSCSKGGAEVEGAELGSQELTFVPGSGGGAVTGGEYRFRVGSAGSTMLVLQTVLPALMTASGPSRVVIEGGTHAMAAPPVDFVERVFLPLIARMGPRVEVRLERHGFYPAGGGKVVVEVEPAAKLRGLHLAERGEVVSRRATALVSQLPGHVAQRELETVRAGLNWEERECHIRTAAGTKTRGAGPGNALLLEIECEHVTEMFSALGEVGKLAEAVAEEAVREARAYLASGVPVGPHLADQLLLPMALAATGGARGSFVTMAPTRHTTTNAEVIRRFLDVRIEMRRGEERTEVVVG